MTAELRRLLAEATPGPWEAVEQTEWEDAYIRQQEDGAPGETLVAENLRQFDGADAALIVWLVNHAAALADLIDAAAEVAAFEDEEDDWRRFRSALAALEGTE